MPVIKGNGSDVITVNGHRVNYQGIAHLRKDMPTEQAVEKTKNNGLDEYYVNVQDDKGRTQRILVYGDSLDFSFRKLHQEPTVTVNGRQAKLVAFDDEETSFVGGMVQGAKKGLSDAVDSVVELAKRVVGDSVAGATTAMLGGAAVLVLGHTLGMGAGFGAAISGLASPITMAALGAAAVAAVVIALAGAVKGGSAALQNRPKMETIAAVTYEANQLNAQQPDGQQGPKPSNQQQAPRPSTQQGPARPQTPIRPVPPVVHNPTPPFKFKRPS